MLLHLQLRQTEGFVGSIFRLINLDLEVPEHTTHSRRPKRLKIPLRFEPSAGPIPVIIDSTGLAIFGEANGPPPSMESAVGKAGELERNLTVDTVLAFLVMAGAALASAAWAGFLPTSMADWAGFWYLVLPFAMPLLAIRRANRIARS